MFDCFISELWYQYATFIVEKTHTATVIVDIIQNSFRTLDLKKATTCRLKKFQTNEKLL